MKKEEKNLCVEAPNASKFLIHSFLVVPSNDTRNKQNRNVCAPSTFGAFFLSVQYSWVWWSGDDNLTSPHLALSLHLHSLGAAFRMHTFIHF